MSIQIKLGDGGKAGPQTEKFFKEQHREIQVSEGFQNALVDVGKSLKMGTWLTGDLLRSSSPVPLPQAGTSSSTPEPHPK